MAKANQSKSENGKVKKLEPITLEGEMREQYEKFLEQQEAQKKAQAEHDKTLKNIQEFNKKREELEAKHGVQMSIDGSQVYKALTVANQAIGKAMELLNQIPYGWVPKPKEEQ